MQNFFDFDQDFQQISHLEIHYFLSDNSHSMDARVRHSCESEILNVIHEIERMFDCKICVETVAYQEGGLREFFSFIDLKNIVNSSISGISVGLLLYFFTTSDKDQLQNQINLQSQIIDLQKQVIQLQNSIHAQEARSRYYSNLEKYSKSEKVQFSVFDKNRKIIDSKLIERKNYQDFIIDPQIKIDVIRDVEIEFVAPVLTKKKKKWNGIYLGKNISFDMTDKEYYYKVTNKELVFSNGLKIVCDLEKTEEKADSKIKISYRVLRVYQHGQKKLGEFLF